MEFTSICHYVGDCTPGPSSADYVDKSHFGNVPPIKIKSRYPIPDDRPDPALANLGSTLGGPKYTMSARHPAPRRFIPPGPSYVPKDDFGRRGSFNTARTRDVIPVTPGPSDYRTNKGGSFGQNSPKTSICRSPRGRLWDTGISPGPAAYKSKWEATRSSSPQTHIRPKFYKKQELPNPRLIPATSTLGGPKYTFARSGRTQVFGYGMC